VSAWFLEKVKPVEVERGCFALNVQLTKRLWRRTAPIWLWAPEMRDQPSPSWRTLAGIGLILLLIVLWAAFVASLAQVVGRWPILIQAPFYLIMGIVWIIPLKPLVRWIQTGSFRKFPRPSRPLK
jgi:hypothetical protein